VRLSAVICVLLPYAYPWEALAGSSNRGVTFVVPRGVLADLFEYGPPSLDAVRALAAHHDLEFHFESPDDLMKRCNVKL